MPHYGPVPFLSEHQKLESKTDPDTGTFAKDYILERERMRLAELLEHGVHPVYGPSDNPDSWEEMSIDWVPDFSWNSSCIAEMQYVLDDEECTRLLLEIKAKYNYDAAQVLRDVIADAQGQ